MVNSYKSEKGKKQVQEECQRIYQNLEGPYQSHEITLEPFGSTYIQEWGKKDNPKLVLLHGTSSNSASWQGYIQSWKKEFHIFALDIPGQPGLSSPLRPSLANGEMRDWLERTLLSMGLESFHLCGMSLGSWIAMDYAIGNPRKVRSLCLITSGGFVAPRKDQLLKILFLMLLGKKGMKRINRLVHGPVKVNPKIEEFGMLVQRHWKPLVEELPLFSDKDLMALNLPLLYVAGEQDILLDTKGTAARISSLMTKAKLNILPEMGHVIVDQHEEIRSFFQDHI